jgi:thiol:disulfide interchange protein DsbG
MRKIRFRPGANTSFPVKTPKPEGEASRETVAILQKHQALMDSLGANATPAIYYLNAENELQQVGMPDAQQLEAMFGPKP